MTTRMKSFRASEDTQYMLDRYSEYVGVSQADLIEMALDWFAASGAMNAVADLKHVGGYKTYPEFKHNAVDDGDVRAHVRRTNGLGVAPITNF